MQNLFDKDFLELGSEADTLRQRMWGKKVFYVNNLHINYTNICVSKCRFCAFARDEGDDDGYFMEIDDILEYVRKSGKEADELHIVGGLHPTAPFTYYTDMLSELKRNFPAKVLKGFSAVEIDYFSRISRIGIVDVIKGLKKAGLDMMPGGGAEIFNPEVRNEICPEKIEADHWLRIHEIAHKEGVKTNATMLYGHLETDEHRMEHLEAIRDLQEKTGGFLAFIPLSFHPENTFLDGMMPSTGMDDLKMVAVSRLVLDNVPHIKAYWVMLGEKTAQIALRFGADDLDGTIFRENITHAAGATSSEGLTEEELRGMITASGLEPVRRNAFYEAMPIK
ncbi:aminofutalosine synthase MqnE [Limisalsivibrio acetivorans]|uniref:aminofutalosine synthase MqnE n=1 Tax=Limisalsivibrio acetivorans TaxID=1304888 RepID=UPI0003B66E67|nr:aminofutalosine synthase MqnE [Limisalsivibrio acetivorans]